MSSFELSRQAQAKIANNEFTSVQVETATRMLLTGISRASSEQTRRDASRFYRQRIKEGADIHCLHEDTFGDVHDCISDLIGKGNIGGLHALLDLGAMPHEETEPLSQVVEATAGGALFRQQFLRLLLRYGVGHAVRTSVGTDGELDSLQPDGEGTTVRLVGRRGELVRLYPIHKVDNAPELKPRVHGEEAECGLMKEMGDAAYAAKQKLLGGEMLSGDELIDLHVGLWHRELEVKAALVNDLASFMKVIEDLPPIIRKSYEGLVREMTASVACSTISGPAQNWRAVEASESQEAVR